MLVIVIMVLEAHAASLYSARKASFETHLQARSRGIEVKIAVTALCSCSVGCHMLQSAKVGYMQNMNGWLTVLKAATQVEQQLILARCTHILKLWVSGACWPAAFSDVHADFLVSRVSEPKSCDLQVQALRDPRYDLRGVDGMQRI